MIQNLLMSNLSLETQSNNMLIWHLVSATATTSTWLRRELLFEFDQLVGYLVLFFSVCVTTCSRVLSGETKSM